MNEHGELTEILRLITGRFDELARREEEHAAERKEVRTIVDRMTARQARLEADAKTSRALIAVLKDDMAAQTRDIAAIKERLEGAFGWVERMSAWFSDTRNKVKALLVVLLPIIGGPVLNAVLKHLGWI